MAKATQLGGFKLYASMWSPAPWLKITSGGKMNTAAAGGPHPKAGTPWPFIWDGAFAGGMLDTSNTPRPEFDDKALGGSGPTSALTQFARCTAAYLRGFQNTYKVRFYGISIQNEVNFEEYYSSCTYPLSSQYIAALKAARAELDKYPDLKPIRILGPEDLLGGGPNSLWQYGNGGVVVHKNLQYLQEIGKDPAALAALDAVCIHGYANDGITSAGADPVQWKRWADGWTTSPGPGIPGNVRGFNALHKKSWLTETSGEQPAWLFPAGAFPNKGGWSVALKIQQALTTGQESAFLYWTFAGKKPEVSNEALTSDTVRDKSPKYVAAKHFFRYIRPGAVRVEAKVEGIPNVTASAFVHETNRTLTVVLVNADAKPATVTLNVPATVPSLQTFTSQENSFWQGSQIAASGGKATATVPGYGVVTLYSGAD